MFAPKRSSISYLNNIKSISQQNKIRKQHNSTPNYNNQNNYRAFTDLSTQDQYKSRVKQSYNEYRSRLNNHQKQGNNNHQNLSQLSHLKIFTNNDNNNHYRHISNPQQDNYLFRNNNKHRNSQKSSFLKFKKPFQNNQPVKSVDKKFRIKSQSSKLQSNNLLSQNRLHQSQPCEQLNYIKDFQQFYSIGKIYWNINQYKQKQQEQQQQQALQSNQLPYIKKSKDKYMFNTKYFFPKRKSEIQRQKFNFYTLKKKCIDIYSHSGRKSPQCFNQYDSIVQNSLKKSIKNLKHYDQTSFARKVVDKIYHDQFEDINDQLKRIHRIKARHNIIQKIKQDRKKLIQQYNEQDSLNKIKPYV